MLRVFVYGTLKVGCPNHSCLKGAVLEGKAEIASDRFVMVNLGCYPALIPSNDGPVIKGETFLINEEILERLDVLEGCPGFYDRELTLVHRGDGSSVEALVYFIGDKSLLVHNEIIEEGVW